MNESCHRSEDRPTPNSNKLLTPFPFAQTPRSLDSTSPKELGNYILEEQLLAFCILLYAVILLKPTVTKPKRIWERFPKGPILVGVVYAGITSAQGFPRSEQGVVLLSEVASRVRTVAAVAAVRADELAVQPEHLRPTQLALLTRSL